jgi:Protein of unknown function (DUF3431)
MSLPRIDLVIARYQEDLSWIDELHNIYDKIIIYNKGSPLTIDNSEVYVLPNYGREAYSYFYHIINNYDTLADITLFIPGSCWAQLEKKFKFLVTIASLKKNKKTVLYCNKNEMIAKSIYDLKLDEYKVTNEENYKSNSNLQLSLCKERPFGNWFATYFPNETLTYISTKGIGAISREDIHKRPLEFYKLLFNQVACVNPEVEYYIERVWKHIFSIDDKNCFQE